MSAPRAGRVLLGVLVVGRAGVVEASGGAFTDSNLSVAMLNNWIYTILILVTIASTPHPPHTPCPTHPPSTPSPRTLPTHPRPPPLAHPLHHSPLTTTRAPSPSR